MLDMVLDCPKDTYRTRFGRLLIALVGRRCRCELRGRALGSKRRHFGGVRGRGGL